MESITYLVLGDIKIMAYPHTPQVGFPLKNYRVNARGFGVEVAGWGIHLGEDILRPAGTPVYSIGRGRVVYSALHPGSDARGNWGNVIIVAHKNPRTRKVFFALYGHMGKRLKQKGERVKMGEKIGTVGAAYSRENGWWVAHVHFGVYIGRWKGVVLPGYYKKGSGRTKMTDWKEPQSFITQYRS
jgi:murein DD-endopeptidase MepM/ murein hydrolase activator NlpD